MGSLEKRLFKMQTLPSDFMRVKFIKVINCLKSHQQKQIWTY